MYINIKSKLALWSPVLFLTGFISDICQGAVKDTNSESIIGTSVPVKKTMNGSIMGFEGYFSLKNVKKAISSLFLMSVTKSKRFLGQEEY